MRHTMRSGTFVPALTTAATTQLGAQAQSGAPAEPAVNMAVPASIHQLEAREVVEQIIAQRHDLLLRPVYEPTGPTKPPYERPVQITTPDQALAKAFAVLTPPQQHQSLMLFAALEPKPGK